MSRTPTYALIVVVALVAASAPVHADEVPDDDPVPCVKVWTDPPDAQVDAACIMKLVEDLPPRP